MTRNISFYPRQIWLLLTILYLSSGAAYATITLPGGDTLLNGAFDEINYGSTGVVYIVPLLYVSELGTTENPVNTATTTDLTYAYNLNNIGGSLATITYSIENKGLAAFTDLRFIVNAQADGSNSFIDSGQTVPSPWGAASGGDPAQFQIADFLDNPSLLTQIVNNNGLNGSDTCGGVCDIDFALQWNIPTINPGDIWNITVGLSDDNENLSSRYLLATSEDTINTVLTFSGTVALVPIPAAYMFYVMGLVGLAIGRTQKKHSRLV